MRQTKRKMARGSGTRSEKKINRPGTLKCMTVIFSHYHLFIVLWLMFSIRESERRRVKKNSCRLMPGKLENLHVYLYVCGCLREWWVFDFVLIYCLYGYLMLGKTTTHQQIPVVIIMKMDIFIGIRRAVGTFCNVR